MKKKMITYEVSAGSRINGTNSSNRINYEGISDISADVSTFI